MGLFKQEPSLADLQEKDEYLATSVSVEQKKAMLRELKQKQGHGAWKLFSDNGTVRGINWARLRAWIKSH